jgi:hypothetical protein
MDKKDIETVMDCIDELATALTDHGHVFDNSLRKLYEKSIGIMVKERNK